MLLCRKQREKKEGGEGGGGSSKITDTGPKKTPLVIREAVGIGQDTYSLMSYIGTIVYRHENYMYCTYLRPRMGYERAVKKRKKKKKEHRGYDID